MISFKWLNDFLRKEWNKSIQLFHEWRGSIILVGVLLLVMNYSWFFAEPVGRIFSDKLQSARLAIAVGIFWGLFFLSLVVTFFWIFSRIEENDNKQSYIITYCYAFIVFALSTSLLPFFILGSIPEIVNIMKLSPIGIVPGCSILVKDSAVTTVPKELHCKEETDQWVVNIGGIADLSFPDTDPRIVPIKGGVVVPLYVVVLALMGAAVSMTRKVPEYQRRLSLGDPEYMNYDQARERLVFQIMQVASAPLIAITVYYIVSPGSRASTIALGFASGFSSETVLLIIRSFLEKMQPVKPSPSIEPRLVKLLPERLDFGHVQVPQTSRKTVGVVNPDSRDVVIASITCTGEFSVMTNTPLIVPAASSTSIDVEFAPKTAGSKLGILTITDNAPGSPRAINLTGSA